MLKPQWWAACAAERGVVVAVCSARWRRALRMPWMPRDARRGAFLHWTLVPCRQMTTSAPWCLEASRPRGV